MLEIQGKYNKAKVFTDNIDEETISQILELCNQKWASQSNIAIMPDTHAGKGCTIGTTMTISSKVCPNLVGVDIGCGMLTVKLPSIFNKCSFEKIDMFINKNIPAGFNIHSRIVYDSHLESTHLNELKCYGHLKNIDALEKSIGTLGGGNHFIEIDEDDEMNRYLVIHTGSRNLGKQVAEYYQKIAYEDCNRQKENKQNELNQLICKLKEEHKEYEIQDAIQEFNKNYEVIEYIPKDLCYLEGYHLDDYLFDMKICQQYATLNRLVIARKILNYMIECISSKKLNIHLKLGDNFMNINDEQVNISCFETIHNYIDMEQMILRKGAIRANLDEIVLIPINMRDGSLIGKGKGNKEYNYSGPHGAGRLLSRSNAKKLVSMEEYQESMKGIYTTSVTPSTIDESCFAYKPIDEIIENIKDSVELIKVIKPIYNFKAH